MSLGNGAMKKYLQILCSFGCLVTTATVQADCCSLPALGRIQAAVERSGQVIVAAINKNAGAVTQQLVANNQSYNRAILQQTQALEAVLKAHALTLNSMEAARLYGEVNLPKSGSGKKQWLTARSPSFCQVLHNAEQLSTAAVVKEKAQTLLREVQRQHNEGFSTYNQATDRLHNADRGDFDLSWLGHGLLAKENLEQAANSINTLINPQPLPKLQEQQKDTPQGISYLAQRAVLNQKYELAQRVLRNQLLQRVPLLGEESSRNSLLGLLQQRIEATVEDNNETPWTAVLEQKGLAALLRELNINLMHLYKLQLTSLQTQQDTAALLAALLANDNHRQRGVVQAAWQRVLAAEGKQ